MTVVLIVVYLRRLWAYLISHGLCSFLGHTGDWYVWQVHAWPPELLLLNHLGRFRRYRFLNCCKGTFQCYLRRVALTEIARRVLQTRVQSVLSRRNCRKISLRCWSFQGLAEIPFSRWAKVAIDQWLLVVLFDCFVLRLDPANALRFEC